MAQPLNQITLNLPADAVKDNCLLGILLPVQPSNPPTADDYTNAIKLRHAIDHELGLGATIDAEVVEMVHLYEADIAAARAVVRASESAAPGSAPATVPAELTGFRLILDALRDVH
ncbi:hypothetical protein FB45DRAFT_1023675 [Roridomyces roridus]|uniref:Uncharacterized protein n=1 Tax=Roridomyces roridus TaxID=1738132 RepID=A0AAD7FV44_9AGAR|nr:hypothetical protein FB45DRAFT_1023675 [Roridomyces roridus]